MGSDDLESYEADLRLQLYREYRDVSRMFRFVVETERGVYLANGVETTSVETGGRPRVVLDLTDAWVWDMYRQHRFVPHVQITTFRDVAIEELAHDDLDVAKRLDLEQKPSTGRGPQPDQAPPDAPEGNATP
ncbi:MAG: DUF2469 family protein [Actinobacteria bacterium]|nr:DUF2469 family protein [Actinomycetota bacterium]